MSFDPKYFGVPPSQQIQKENRYAYTATSGQTTFAASYTAGFGPDVFYNGSHLDPRTQFTAVDGATVVLTTGADTGASIVIVAKAQQPNYNFYTQQETNALVANFYASSTGGTTSAITASTNPSFTSWLFDGMEVKIRMSAANPSATTAPTISINGMTALTIVRDGQQPLTGLDWNANDEVTLRYSAGYGNLTLTTGKLTAITPAQFNSTPTIATTAFVQQALGNVSGIVGITSATTLTASQFGSVISCGGSTAYTVTLPAPGSTTRTGGYLLSNYGTGQITVSTPSGLFAGASTGTSSTYILPSLSSVYVVTDGANWVVGGGNGSSIRSTSGYQKMPGGIIFQWMTGASTSAGTCTVSLPIAFPTQLGSASVCYINNGGALAAYSCSISNGSTASALTASICNASGTAVNGANLYFWAVGW
jgi:hypothetical protein